MWNDASDPKELYFIGECNGRDRGRENETETEEENEKKERTAGRADI